MTRGSGQGFTGTSAERVRGGQTPSSRTEGVDESFVPGYGPQSLAHYSRPGPRNGAPMHTRELADAVSLFPVRLENVDNEKHALHSQHFLPSPLPSSSPLYPHPYNTLAPSLPWQKDRTLISTQSSTGSWKVSRSFFDARCRCEPVGGSARARTSVPVVGGTWKGNVARGRPYGGLGTRSVCDDHSGPFASTSRAGDSRRREHHSREVM
jgi:hypothetical protein